MDRSKALFTIYHTKDVNGGNSIDKVGLINGVREQFRSKKSTGSLLERGSLNH